MGKMVLRRNFTAKLSFNDHSKNLISEGIYICHFVIQAILISVLAKKHVLADFGAKNFGPKLEKLGKMFWPKIARNENFIMQRWYCEQTLFYKIF